MAVEIVMPRLSDSMEAGTIARWLVAEGAQVAEGEPLVEVETDKASVTYESEHDGTLLRIAAAEGESVAVGAVIAVIGPSGEDDGAGSQAAAVSPAFGREPGAAAVVSPASGREPGGAPVVSPASGREPGAAAPGTQAASGTVPRPTADGTAAGHPRVKASPLARRIAQERGIDLASLSGTGPQGRVTRADVERSPAEAQPQTDAPRADEERSPAEAQPQTDAPRADEERSPAEPRPQTDVPADTGPAEEAITPATRLRRLSRLQQTVGRRMALSRATIPDFELRCEVDMSAAGALREQLRGHCDPLPSYNDMIVKAAALTLRDHPRVNASYRDDAVHEHERVNVGIAVAAEDALVVPTIFDADTLSLAQLAVQARRLAERVRDGTVSPSELAGGTFTVSNLGMYGIDDFSAVINPPQAAILAVGSVAQRPLVDEAGQIVARPTVRLSLACDHRVLYGADGARFLARLRELLSRPIALLVA